MLQEPYNFTENDLKNESSSHEEQHLYEKGGLCPLEVDTDLKSYKTIKLLGEGAYSTVWEVSKENNKYAIKISKANKDDEETGQNEIKILRKLGKNPYILNLYDTFHYKSKNGKHLCMVIDNLGFDLHVLKRLFKYSNSESNSELSNDSEITEVVRGLPLNLSKKIIYQILKGLEHIHSKNIIHTDIKLENILITNTIDNIKYNKDINIKICDFGTSHPTTNKSNYNIGTIDYSAPECIIGLPYGKGIDIWAVGCIVFELVTGVCLFDYTRYYDDADEYSSGFSSSDFEDENDKTQIEFLLLCMMKKILGGFPSKIFKKGKYYDNYFDYKGRLRFSPKFLEEDEIINVLINEFNYESDEAVELNDFVLKLLCIDPSQRENVTKLLTNKWFEGKCD